MDLGEPFFLCREEALEVAFPLHPRNVNELMRGKNAEVVATPKKATVVFFFRQLVGDPVEGHDNSELQGFFKASMPPFSGSIEGLLSSS